MYNLFVPANICQASNKFLHPHIQKKEHNPTRSFPFFSCLAAHNEILWIGLMNA
jgi:hypothetical protein